MGEEEDVKSWFLWKVPIITDMTQVTLDIPESAHAQDIWEAARYFVQFSHKHPESMEDILLGIRMLETDDDATVPLSEFLSWISK